MQGHVNYIGFAFQLEIAQNEIWTLQKFPAIWYVIVCAYAMGTGTHRSGNHLQQQLLVLEVHCSYLNPKYSRSMNIINAEKDFLWVHFLLLYMN